METLRYVLLANGLLAIVSITYYVLLRRETFFGANRLTLWLGLTASLGLPLLELPDWRPQPVRAVMQRTAQVIVPRVLPDNPTLQPDPTAVIPDKQTSAVSAQQPTSVWSWQAWLTRIYVAVATLLLIRFGFQLISLWRLIQQSEHEPYDDFVVVKNPRVTSPFSFFNWVVLNPDYHAPDELDHILRHERVHVRKRHSIDLLGAELLCILLWFNPAIYLFRYLLHQTLEFSADRAVLAEGVDAKTYQYNLVKVSLASGRSTLTNHFSRSQLKSRIAMLNKQESSRLIWLKYPVLAIATLTVVAAFARPNVRTLKTFMPGPVAKTAATIMKAERVFTPQRQVVESDQTKPVVDNVLTPTPVSQQKSIQSDTISSLVKPDTVRASPSRYMVYKGNYLYWVVTPKTTFDDFVVMKQEFARHGNQMQLNEVKFDPLYVYIDRIVFSVVKDGGGSTQVDDLDDENKPISSVAGYISIGKNAGSRGTGSVQSYPNSELPEQLRRVVADDEAVVAQFVKDRRVDYMLKAGIPKFANLGNTSATYHKEFFKNKSTRSSGLIVHPDGSLSIDEALGAIKVFINNEAVSPEAVQLWSAKQLYAVVKKSQYNPAKKESFTSALLIYVNEDI